MIKNVARLILILHVIIGQIQAQNNVEADVKKLQTFLESVDSKYVDSVETYSLVEKAIREMLKTLDPHSIYMDRESYQSSMEQLNGKFQGIGIRYHYVDDTLTVLEVFENSGAQKAGLQLGDQIISLGSDTISGSELNVKQVSEIFHQHAESNEGFTVWRNHGKERFLMHISRSYLELNSVSAAFMIDKKLGYIKLSKFTYGSYDEVRTAVDNLKKENMKALIFDLRGNSGGYLNRAIKIVDEFMEDRRLIVYTEGVNQPKRETFATSGGRYTDGDLILLIDENSASASEIVAGAIQDWDRGLIIGRRSYGKGLVQRPVEFEDGSAMRLTISRYYTPTGRSIQQPYSDGYDSYRQSHQSRYITGELLTEDSIKVADSLVYFTPKNRKVYGGGGIIPDVFVPADTSEFGKEITDLIEMGLHYGFAIHYANQHRSELLDAFENVNTFLSKFDFQESIQIDLFDYLEKHGLSVADYSSNQIQPELEEVVKPLIVRFVYGYNEYARALLEYDNDFLAAREAIEKDTMLELGLK